MKRIIKQFTNKFINDVVWNLASTGILGLSGIVSNIIIGNAYHADGLGVYNRALALYMLFSIVTVFGVNTSLIKHVAEYKDQQGHLNEIITSALLFVGSLSLGCLLLLYGCLPCFYDEPLLKILYPMLPALPFFSVNRVLLGALNGLRRMRVFAIMQALRWILIIGFVGGATFLAQPLAIAVGGFLITEIILLGWLSWYIRKYYTFSLHDFLPWLKVHSQYGWKIIIAASVGELNHYADILMISFFLSDTAVGIYSFASTIAKGIVTISAVIQLNFSPIISNLWTRQALAELKTCIVKVNRGSFLLMTPVIVAAGIVFPFFVHFSMRSSAYQESLPVFYILLIGIWVKSIFYWAGSFFTMAGFPGFNVRFGIIVLLFNIVGNAVLIPLIGINGAAVSTSAADVLLIVLLGLFLKKKLQINIFVR